MFRSLGSAVVALSLGLAGCFSDYGDAPFACKEYLACPYGYACVDGVCRRDVVPTPPASRLDHGWAQDAGAPASDLFRADHAPPATFPDLASSALTCSEILQCCIECTTDPCCAACWNAGSPPARAAFDALEGCSDEADYGVCDYYCYPNSQSPGCNNCIINACHSEYLTCEST